MHAIAPTDSAMKPNKAVTVVIALALAITFLATYTFVHEGGHALVGLLFGGRVTSFSINFWDISAHVSLDGEFSTAQRALVSVAGVGLPLLLLAVFVALTPRRPSASLDLTRLIAALGVLSTLLAWIVIPFLYLAGRAPGDDSANFLNLTAAPPVLVAALALAVYVAGWFLFFARIGGARATLDRFRRAAPDLLAPDSLRDLRSILAVGAVVAAVAFASGLYFQRTNPLGLPAGFREVARLNLAETAADHETVYRFTLDRPGRGEFFVLLRDAAGPAQVVLIGPGGALNLFTAPAGAALGQVRVGPGDRPLDPGEYRLELTLPRQPGAQVAVYAEAVP